MCSEWRRWIEGRRNNFIQLLSDFAPFILEIKTSEFCTFLLFALLSVKIKEITWAAWATSDFLIEAFFQVLSFFHEATTKGAGFFFFFASRDAQKSFASLRFCFTWKSTFSFDSPQPASYFFHHAEGRGMHIFVIALNSRHDVHNLSRVLLKPPVEIIFFLSSRLQLPSLFILLCGICR